MKQVLKFSVVAVILLVFVGTLVFLYKKIPPARVWFYQLDSPARMTIVKKTVAIGKVIPRAGDRGEGAGFGSGGQAVRHRRSDREKRATSFARISLRPSMLNVNSAESQLQTSKINLANQAADLERYQKLFAQHLISETDFKPVYDELQCTEGGGRVRGECPVVVENRARPRNSGFVSNMIPATIDGTVLDTPNKEGAFIVETSTFQSGTTVRHPWPI